ncbi:MAG: HD domain-containing phosphohydrolase [Trueperaceae bacterium]|nr:HD domain-containing phosphohydrolase [Trueperaceae bacterium]
MIAPPTVSERRPSEPRSSEAALPGAAHPGAAHPGAAPLRLSDVVSALTYALDITEGQPEGHALRSCAIGMAIGERLGLDAEGLSDLYYALLLKDLGCSSNSARLAATFGADDRRVKHAYKLIDLDRPRDGLGFVIGNAGSAAPPLQRLRHVVDVSLGRGGGQRALTEIRCERGADIARELGFSAVTSEAIRALDEHWDGGGHPYRLEGDAIPLAGRILCLAQTVEVFAQAHGPEAAMEVARRRSGRWFDPAVVAALGEAAGEAGFWEGLSPDGLEARVRAAEPVSRMVHADADRLDRVAAAFARVIDAKSPWTFRHSERVRAFALGIAEELGLPPERRPDLSRAALLHDLGKLGVPNLILDKPGRLSEDEFAVIRRHPADSQRILERVGPFRVFAEVAGAHHERMDGRGYHGARRAGELPLEARILATADPFEALTASRPYRDGMSTEEALGLLRRDVGAGVDQACLAALEGFLATSAGAELLASAEVPTTVGPTASPGQSPSMSSGGAASR